MDSDPLLSTSRLASERFWHRAALLFIVITSLLRLCILPMLELSADEAYYWDWSRHLALGYYDQGPMIAYLIRATTLIFGTNEFGVRFGVWLVSVGTLVCTYILARRISSSLAGFLAVLFLALTPLFSAGSLIATYDPPLVFFWALTLIWLERALFAPDCGTQNRAWLLAGLASGLGFLSKHTMLLIVPCIVLFLLLSPAHRFWLLRPQPYLGFLITLLLYSGVFWWNAHHHWWTFGHLVFLAHKTSGTPVRQLGDLLGSQALLLGPGLFVGCLAALYAITHPRGKVTAVGSATPGAAMNPPMGADREGNSHDNWRARIPLFLCCFGFPVLCFFCLMTLKAKVQGTWAPCAWITPTIALGITLANQIEERGQNARRAIRYVWLIGVTSSLVTLLVLSPWLRYVIGVRLPPDSDVSNKAYGWRQMALQADQFRSEMRSRGRPVFVAANNYQTCALLAFYLPDHPQTYELFLGYRLNNYAVNIDELRQRLGENALFVDEYKGEDAGLRALFERVEWTEAFPTWRRPFFSQPIRSHNFAKCYNFRRFIGLLRANGG
jgi:hypothetical protein